MPQPSSVDLAIYDAWGGNAGSGGNSAGSVSRRSRAYQAIKEAIINFRFKPGNPLSEDQLAADIGVSRTPIREALHRLEQEGLVTIVPYRGASVSHLTLDDIREIFEVREALEATAARVAARKISPSDMKELNQIREAQQRALAEKTAAVVFKTDNTLHDFILRLAGNRRLRRFTAELNGQVHRIRFLSATAEGRVESSIREHLAILAAIEERNPRQAERRMRFHMRQIRRNIQRLHRQYQGFLWG